MTQEGKHEGSQFMSGKLVKCGDPGFLLRKRNRFQMNVLKVVRGCVWEMPKYIRKTLSVWLRHVNFPCCHCGTIWEVYFVLFVFWVCLCKGTEMVLKLPFQGASMVILREGWYLRRQGDSAKSSYRTPAGRIRACLRVVTINDKGLGIGRGRCRDTWGTKLPGLGDE